jgi:alpha-tubulin suppressor-like RCC1 family protein
MEVVFRQECVLSCGNFFTVVVTPEGRVVFLGVNPLKQCVPPPAGDNVIAVSAGSLHSAALTRDGRVVCWGDNSRGQCEVPAEVGSVVAVSCGAGFTMALTSSGEVKCWGNSNGYLFEVPDITERWIAISAGDDYCGAISESSKIFCWPQTKFQLRPFAVEVPLAESLFCWYRHTTVLTHDGRLLSWGRDGFSEVPAGDQNIVTFSSRGFYFAAVTQSGSVIGNFHSQCIVPADLNNVVSASCSHMHVAALTQDGVVVCWGRNDVGQCNVPENAIGMRETNILM